MANPPSSEQPSLTPCNACIASSPDQLVRRSLCAPFQLALVRTRPGVYIYIQSNSHFHFFPIDGNSLQRSLVEHHLGLYREWSSTQFLIPTCLSPAQQGNEIGCAWFYSLLLCAQLPIYACLDTTTTTTTTTNLILCNKAFQSTRSRLTTRIRTVRKQGTPVVGF